MLGVGYRATKNSSNISFNSPTFRYSRNTAPLLPAIMGDSMLPLSVRKRHRTDLPHSVALPISYAVFCLKKKKLAWPRVNSQMQSIFNTREYPPSQYAAKCATESAVNAP